MTPRKFNALVRVHMKFNDPNYKPKEQQRVAYIDQIF